MGRTFGWMTTSIALLGLALLARGGAETRRPVAKKAAVADVRGTEPAATYRTAPTAAESAISDDLRSRFPGAAGRIVSPLADSEFPAVYSDGLVVREGGAIVRQQLRGGGSSAIVREGAIAVYPGVQPGVDAMMTREPGRTEEFLRIAPGAASHLTYEFRIESAAHTFLSDSALSVVDSGGKSVVSLDEIVYWVSGDRDERVAETTVTLTDSRTAVLAIAIPAQDQSQEILLDPSWTATGAMITPRNGYSATRLANGKVLVAGGYKFGGNSGNLRSCELFDPATGAWSRTGSLKSEHVYHAAALLPNGRVLVAGGFPYGSMSAAEVYDPASGRWSSTGSMLFGSVMGALAPLANGKVLSTNGTTSAELYDPATGGWSATGSLNEDHPQSTATLLRNGKVLVIGGGLGSTTPCELYDPASGTWSVTGNLLTTRYAHGATLLADGRVLASGGWTITPTGPRSALASMIESCEIYDPASGSWSTTGSLPRETDAQDAVLLDNGKVFVVRSYQHLYDPSTGLWTEGAHMGSVIFTLTKLADGRVLARGGLYSGVYTP